MKALTTEDIQALAKQFDIGASKIKAVSLVESSGSGFYPDYIKIKGKEIVHPYAGELVVRFEGHWFRKFTKGIYDTTNPDLSYTDWKQGNKHHRGLREFSRFYNAFELDKEAAWQSTSWGMFQTMGFNYKACGYDSPKDMIVDYYKGEVNQLKGFLNYLQDKDILDDLKAGRFSTFARIYNGRDFKKHGYDTKIANFDKQYLGKI